jgi:hypothetical protein
MRVAASLLLLLTLAGCRGIDHTAAGHYPEFEPTDYSYRLTFACFCVAEGVPMRVVVEDGAAVGATFVGDDGSSGIRAGDPVEPIHWVTINEIIRAANDTSAYRVDVDWPAGQDYPSSVGIDPDEDTIDDEVGYLIGDVRVA